jgi:hypothetical protein
VRLDAHFEKTIAELEIDERQNWRRKHLGSIKQNYSRAPDFKKRFGRLTAIFENRTCKLAELCRRQLDFWLSELGITTPILRASELPVSGQKSDLVLNLCKYVGATRYLSGPLGRGYLEEDKFCESGVKIDYHQFIHPLYPQMFGEFVPAMGIVDYWLNSVEPSAFRGTK